MGPGRLSENHPLFDEVVRHARSRPMATGRWTRATCCWSLARASTIASPATSTNSPPMPDRPRRHRRLRAQQEQARPHAICSDLKHALGRLNELLAAANFAAPDIKAWHDQISAWKRDNPFRYEASPHIQPQEAVRALFELTRGDAIITTGVGQHQMWAASITTSPSRAGSSVRSGSAPWALATPRHRRQGRLPGPAGDRHRRRRFLPDECAGTGHL